MNSVKILHCADLHIGTAVAGLGEKGLARKHEALLTFENIIRLAANQGVRLLLIAGDLLSSNQVSIQTVRRILECVASLGETKVVFAAGNHDPIGVQSPFGMLALPDNFHILPAEDACLKFEDIGVCVYGRSFSEVYLKGENRFSLTPDENYINIMCQHGELRSDISSNYNSVTTEFIDNCGMDYIALGHIHKRTEIMRRGNTFFAYSGCAEGLGFDETGDKGVYIGEVGKGKCELRFFKTSVRTFEKAEISVEDCADTPAAADKILSSLKEKYGDSFSDNFYKVILTGGLPDGVCFDTGEIAARLMQTVYFAKVNDQTSVCADLELLRKEKSLKGIFTDKMLSKIEAEPENAEKLRAALSLGLKAFYSEVDYRED